MSTTIRTTSWWHRCSKPDANPGNPSALYSRQTRIAVCLLLTTQASLLAYSATQHSPTYLEPAFLASGLSHWQFGRFDLYRVNPPLVRMVAALPVVFAGAETDWSRYSVDPGSRAEFAVGNDFVKANGPHSIRLLLYARWACIPFSLCGAYVAYRWSKELYGCMAGLTTLVLYVFEPNLLAHGELITPDGACTAFGILASYSFWKWLQRPTTPRTLLAGAALGVAELSKMSWLILFGLWPLLWVIWRLCDSTNAQRNRTGQPTEPETIKTDSPSEFSAERPPSVMRPPSLAKLCSLFAVAFYIINLGYAFDGLGERLADFRFVSSLMTGLDEPGVEGNRFRDSWLGNLPLPLPKQYILGFDAQKKDLEDFGHKSYLRGEWRDQGWWYYYLYGFLVKVPCGTWCLFTLVVVLRATRRNRPIPLRDEAILLLPTVFLLAVVSTQTEFNHHFRYVFPSLAFTLIFVGQAGLLLTSRFALISFSVALLISYSLISVLLVYPRHLCYFNDFVGGPQNGYKHLLGSSCDWEQELFEVRQWMHDKGVSRIVYKPAAFSMGFAQRYLNDWDIPSTRDVPEFVVESFGTTTAQEHFAKAGVERIGLAQFAYRSSE